MALPLPRSLSCRPKKTWGASTSLQVLAGLGLSSLKLYFLLHVGQTQELADNWTRVHSILLQTSCAGFEGDSMICCLATLFLSIAKLIQNNSCRPVARHQPASHPVEQKVNISAPGIMQSGLPAISMQGGGCSDQRHMHVVAT